MATLWNDRLENSVQHCERRARDRLIALAHLMDSAITLPGVRRGVGLDPLLGLMPIAGDAVSELIGLYSVLEARELGVALVAGTNDRHLLLDAALGAVPIAGDVADVF